ncbi:MAG: metalloregulator ArsR/SmtB family transcription factor [Burkholderiaceae bacterium]
MLEGVARYFSLLSDPTRLRIMHTICSVEKSVTQIVRETGAAQTNVSRHLSTLYGAGVLSRRKSGNFIFYRVSDQTLIEICRTACVHFAARHESDEPAVAQALSLAEGFAAGEVAPGSAAGSADREAGSN